jgi:hypothetical protein
LIPDACASASHFANSGDAFIFATDDQLDPTSCALSFCRSNEFLPTYAGLINIQ